MKGITDGSPTQSIHPSDGRPLRVYSDIPAVTDLLSQPEFILGENDQDLSLRFVSCGLTSTLSSCWHLIPTSSKMPYAVSCLHCLFLQDVVASLGVGARFWGLE
jgi:hypothetical protein